MAVDKMQNFIKEQYRKLIVVQGWVLEFAIFCNDQQTCQAVIMQCPNMAYLLSMVVSICCSLHKRANSRTVQLNYCYIPYTPYMQYAPLYFYIFSHFWGPFLCFQGGFFRQFCLYVWLVFKSLYDGAVKITVFQRVVLEFAPLCNYWQIPWTSII